MFLRLGRIVLHQRLGAGRQTCQALDLAGDNDLCRLAVSCGGKSLKRFETVFPAVGSPSSAIELNLDELYKYSNALEWIDVCKLPAPAEA